MNEYLQGYQSKKTRPVWCKAIVMLLAIGAVLVFSTITQTVFN